MQHSRMMLGVVQVMCGCALLAGCADPNELSEEAITAALQDEVSSLTCGEFLARLGLLDDFQESYVPGAEFSLQVPILFGLNFATGEYRQLPGGPAHKLDQLVELGVMSRADSKTTYTTERSLAGTHSRPNQTATYTLTETGKQMVIVEEQSKRNGGSWYTPKFCIGRGEVAKIIDFTLPGDAAVQSTRVAYQWKAADVSDVARRVNESGILWPANRAAPLSGTETTILELSNNGWRLRD